MKIAVPTDDGLNVAAHFGRSAGFIVFEVEEGQIRSRELRENAPHAAPAEGSCGQQAAAHGGHDHGTIVAALSDCSVVICGGMGSRAAAALRAAGISEIIPTPPAPAEAAVRAFLDGSLTASAQGFCRCSH
jgi:predicted Fe-Mo cluster-binding NifX family protein